MFACRMVTVLSCVTQPSVSVPTQVPLPVPTGIVSIADLSIAASKSSKNMDCQSITIPMCQNMPYNATRMPNLFGMTNQQEAIVALEQFQYLPETNCSPYLVFFLCVLYTPICTSELPSFLAAIPPCRQVCEHVRMSCEPFVNKMGFIWPTALDCQSYPDVTKGVCLTPDAILTKPSTSLKFPENCPCFRHPKLKQRLYLKRRFDYALRAKVMWTETFGNLTLTNIEVIQVFKRNHVLIEPLTREVLWTNTSCGTCPRLDPGREYFLLGHEDLSNKRLLYTHLSVGLEWRKKYAEQIVKWEKAKKQTANAKGGNGSH